jgi:hypothetical protein
VVPVPWPETEDDLWRWVLGLMVACLATAIAVWKVRSSAPVTDVLLAAKVFDSATFAMSLMLLIGIVQPTVLALIGNTKPFLIVAALAGLIYSGRSLFRVPAG